MLPAVDGLGVCKVLKANPRTQHIPIMMVTAKTEEADVVSGLELGADDYITKPFSPRVLLGPNSRRLAAQAQAGARRPHHDQDSRIGDSSGPPRGAVVAASRLELTFTEFRLLQFLARKPGWAFSRNQIVDAVKGEDYPVTERSVDVQVAGLRKKLGDLGSYIETVRGVGYRFKE